MRIISIEFAASEETHVQFFGQVVVEVAAKQAERSASAKGNIVIPFPTGQIGDGSGSASEGDTGEGKTDTGETEVNMGASVTEGETTEIAV